MTELSLPTIPPVNMTVLKMKGLSLRLLHALDAFAGAKVGNAVLEWCLREAQRKMKRGRRLMHGSRNSAVRAQQQIGRRSSYRLLRQGVSSSTKQERTPIPEAGEELIRPEAEITNVVGRTVTLALSVSRTYDSALEILRAYKLTGNFHVNLEIVLKDMDALDKVTFEVEPQRTYLADCRRVLFRPTENVPIGQFSEILSSIKSRIGFDATRTCWAGIS